MLGSASEGGEHKLKLAIDFVFYILDLILETHYAHNITTNAVQLDGIGCANH